MITNLKSQLTAVLRHIARRPSCCLFRLEISVALVWSLSPLNISKEGYVVQGFHQGLTHGSPMVSAALKGWLSRSSSGSTTQPISALMRTNPWCIIHQLAVAVEIPNDQTNWATYPSYLEKMCVPKSTFFTQCENGSSKKLYFVMQPSQPAQKTGKVCFFTKRRGCK